MFEYAEQIKPLLLELDKNRPLNRPVRVKEDLVPLFKKHTVFKEISRYPLTGSSILGMHLSASEQGQAHIFSRYCSIHGDGEVETSCPECQSYRLYTAKELVHALDTKDLRTSADVVSETIIDQLLKGAIDNNAQVHADGVAIFWAIELLVRYRHRIEQTGDFGRFHPNSALISARKNNDYTYIGKQYGVPSFIAHIAFSDRYMDTMRAIRLSVGLPITFGEWE